MKERSCVILRIKYRTRRDKKAGAGLEVLLLTVTDCGGESLRGFE